MISFTSGLIKNDGVYYPTANVKSITYGYNSYENARIYRWKRSSRK